ncbi:hypothetical protein HH310_17570 [Actinoplanes sp. TBRC 11911]|uniref:hypothetical protein n=1 Tax=Actinoplanes sp. TBRC 11911 TaxID=2729386 RepID=UPI00145F3CF4|nr:hypothetical protein [Actinoplanes sp. TBRC 11911]NMO52994.1 hypothetical protein [Actinoplanes sp. TBRC 11911]
MSYDLMFVPKSDDQSWDEALAAAEQDDNSGRPSPEVWASLVAAARQVLGEVSVSDSESSYELDHSPTGIQLSYYAREADITVPYWYSGERARAIVSSIYQLASAVEKATGFPGYDPQVDLPVTEATDRPELAVDSFDQVAASFAERGITSPSNAS